MKKVTYIVLAISLITTAANAQKKSEIQPELNSGNIEQQFDYIINKSTSYKAFQLIRKTSILKVKSNAMDSITLATYNLVEAKKSEKEAVKTVAELKAEVKNLNLQIETISKDVDSISFLGMPLSKTAYNSLVWLIIVALFSGLLIFMFLFKKSNLTTKSAVSNLEKVDLDFENFRKKALTKEQETMRKLQDEINKHSH